MERDKKLTLVGFGRVLFSRRAFTALFSITCLTLISLKNGTDTSMAIASVAVGLAAANSHQKRGQTAENKTDV